MTSTRYGGALGDRAHPPQLATHPLAAYTSPLGSARNSATLPSTATPLTRAPGKVAPSDTVSQGASGARILGIGVRRGVPVQRPVLVLSSRSIGTREIRWMTLSATSMTRSRRTPARH